MGLIGGTIQSGISAKRDRQAASYTADKDRAQAALNAANELAYKKTADKLAYDQKERELALTGINAQHEWEGQSATRDSTLAQLFKAQAIEARRAAMGHSFASALGRGSTGDAGGAATRRLMALLGNVNNYGGSK